VSGVADDGPWFGLAWSGRRVVAGSGGPRGDAFGLAWSGRPGGSWSSRGGEKAAHPTGSPAHQVPPGHKIYTFILILKYGSM
jgi:hypothetical protein